MEDILLDLIGQVISREEASNWARQWTQDDDIEIEESVWTALSLLLGADLPDLPEMDRPYLYDERDFRQWLTDLRNSRPNNPK